MEALGALFRTHFWWCFWRPFGGDFGALTPPKRAGGRRGPGPLWGPGNIAFGPLQGENAVCFCTFSTGASAKPQRDVTKVTYRKFLLQRPREVAVNQLSFLCRDRAEVSAKKFERIL